MFVYESYIDKKICKDLINLFEKEKKVKENNDHTKMTTVFLNRSDSNLFDYLSALTKILEKYKKKYKYIDQEQEPWEIHEQIKIQKYEPGQSYFRYHSESSGYNGNNNRILVFSSFLNNIEKGGETEFFYQKQKIKVKEGKTILFPPFWTHTHKGNIATETKYIITGWYTYVH